MDAGRAETAGAARRFARERFHRGEYRAQHRHEHHLRDALARLDHDRLGARRIAVPDADHDRTLVVGIDHADRVAQHQAFLVSQPRARRDRRGHIRVAHMHRDAGRHQLRRRAGLDRQRGVQAGVQIDRGGHVALIAGQAPLVQARVKDLDFDGRVRGRGHRSRVGKEIVFSLSPQGESVGRGLGRGGWIQNHSGNVTAVSLSPKPLSRKRERGENRGIRRGSRG